MAISLTEPVFLNEPSGHGGRYSKIERIWQSLPSGYSLELRRIERFDRVASLLYSPVEYIARDISASLPVTAPPHSWVIENFLNFVLGEFGRESVRPLPDTFDPIETVTVTQTDAPQKYLEHCESELVYGGIFRRFRAKQYDSIEDAIYEVLVSPPLGNQANRKFLDRHEFATRIGPSVLQHKRLQFILPAFPFKDQNIFRTEARPDHIDLGDISLLIRLHSLALAFFQIHPFGADWIVLSDGAAYADALGVDARSAESYRENLRDKRNQLNLQGTVTILDLHELAKHTDGERYKGRFENTVLAIREILRTLIRSHDEVQRHFTILTRGIAWNLATRIYEKRFSREEIWRAVTSVGVSNSETRNALFIEVQLRSEEAALFYAAYNLALRWFRIPSCVFPEAIRTTVHPKAGQVAVPSLGLVYPWNGIPVVLHGTFRSNDIVVTPWCDWRRGGRKLMGHAERADLSPLYYTSS